MLCRTLGVVAVLLGGCAAALAQQPGGETFAGDAPPPAPIPTDPAASVAGEPFPALDVVPFLRPGGPAAYRWWVGGEFLLGWTREAPIDTSLLSAGPPASLGILGAGGTSILGNQKVDFGTYTGVRLGGGIFLDECRAYAAEWSAFYLPRRSRTLTATAAAGQALGRPFFDLSTNAENVRQLTLPGRFVGGLTADISNEVYGFDLGSAVRVYADDTFSLDQLISFKYVGVEEKLSVTDFSTAQPLGLVSFNRGVFGNGATVSVNDFVSAVNRFYGGNAGLRVNWTPGRFSASLTGRFGAGSMEQSVGVIGSTTLSRPGQPDQTVAGGFLTIGRNGGNTHRYELAFAPEVGLNVGYRLTDHLTVSGGYNLLYLTNVARPGQDLTRVINPTNLVSGANFGTPFPAAEPSPQLNSSDFWIQTLSVGLTFNF